MKHQHFKLLTKILILICIGFTSCKPSRLALNPKAVLYKQAEDEGRDDIYYNRIRPEDELLIKELHGYYTIFSADKNLFKVDADSNISLPILGKVKVGGLTRQQTSEKICNLYGKKEILTPAIEVTIANMHVTVLGEVMKQGNYPIVREDYVLTDLLGDAQGFSSNANTEKVKIIRKVNNTQVSISNSHFISNREFALKSGDLVYVPPKPWTVKLKNIQQYTGLIQLGLVLISTLTIALNR